MTSIEVAFDKLRDSFALNSNPEKAIGMSQYMRNRFSFVGINAPTRKTLFAEIQTLFKPQNSQELISWIQTLWDAPEREYQYIAMEYLKKYIKLLGEQDFWLFEFLIVNKSWWDTVDIISANCLGKFLRLNHHLLHSSIIEFSKHPNFWINRAAIICQLTYRYKTQKDLLKVAIQPHLTSNEFFLQKAIGWALREYAKTNKEWVLYFVERETLKPLSKREALKIIQKQTTVSK